MRCASASPPTARPSSSGPTRNSPKKATKAASRSTAATCGRAPPRSSRRCPNGSTMTGAGIAELDVSADGERVLIGKKVSEDSAGNEFFDLYMHVGNSPNSIEVDRNRQRCRLQRHDRRREQGLLHDAGQTGRRHRQQQRLLSSRTSAPRRRSRGCRPGTGGTAGNTDSCEPISNWNVVSGGPDCGTASIAGGGGVASGDGTAYFVSPELLDGPEQRDRKSGESLRRQARSRRRTSSRRSTPASSSPASSRRTTRSSTRPLRRL